MDLIRALKDFFDEYYGSFDELPVAKPGAIPHFQKILEKATTNWQYRKNLLSSPEETLKKEGVALPEGLQIVFVEDTDKLVHLPILPYAGGD